MTAFEITSIFESFCSEHGLSVELNWDMPFGYETAYGTYDVTINTLFLNLTLLENTPKYEILFYLFHELRHAMQYLRPQDFAEEIQSSRFYVILYNGICYKLINLEWQCCEIEGDEEYWTNAYLGLPYEQDANKYAYEQAQKYCGVTDKLTELYNFWKPTKELPYSEYQSIFSKIDSGITSI